VILVGEKPAHKHITSRSRRPIRLLDIAAQSVPGSVHPYEDRLLVDEGLGLFAVADGVTLSTQGSGAVGAELALRLLRDNLSGDLASAIDKVNQIVVRRMGEDRTIGETTLTAVVVRQGALQAANVGDSPAYLVRKGDMLSLVQEDRSPYGYITQAIGLTETVSVHAMSLQLEEGDTVIVASDGVGHVLCPPFVDRMVDRSKAAEVAGAIIQVASANVTEYDDDKSVIVLRYLP